MIYIIVLVASILLGLCLMGIGVYLWLASKKIIAGLILLGLGLALALVPVALIVFFAITSSVRG